MTWMRSLLAPTLALSLIGMPAGLAAQDDDEILPQTLPVELNPDDPTQKEIGELIYKGGLRVEPGEEKIGGISGLEWVDDEDEYGGGALYAVSDDGRWLKIVPEESNGTLTDIYGIRMDRLRDLKGKPLKKKRDADAEAIARNPQGDWLISFEQDHRVWRYTDLEGAAQREGDGPLPQLELTAANNGIETLAQAGDGGLVCAERYAAAATNCVRVKGRAVEALEITPPPSLIEHGGTPTDAACMDDNTCYILMRSYKPGYGNRAAIIELAPDNSQTTLAVFDAPLTLDNFEGLAVREQFGKRYLYIASDDNFNNCFESERANCQDTLILKFQIKGVEGPLPPLPPAALADPRFETVDVVLETTLGDITIALEVERAPITAANFLRYVEEGRFDGTSFYRAMKLDLEPKPNGLIQGGTRGARDRVLPPIAHEPTTKTGLSHVHGAVSMARGEVGSATGDFTIMVRDRTGLDANPQSDDPIWQAGYAVFGSVIDGMDTIAAIHAAQTDPDAGEGALKGQMIAEPIVITKARRAEPKPEPDETDAGA